MLNLSSLENLLPKRIQQNQQVENAHQIYTHTCDTFQKSDSVKDVAVEFKKNLFDSIDDWNVSIPANGENGSTLLKKILAPYTQFVDTLNERDAERFVTLVFGENQVGMLEETSLKNDDVYLFQTTLEKRLGKTIREVVVK